MGQAECVVMAIACPRRPKTVSKKEQQAAIKEKQEKRQGHRTAKTGSKANKFDAEAAGKKANQKNGLLH